MVLASILLSASAAQAGAASGVRMLHTIPGGPGAELRLSGAGSSDPVGFGEATDYLNSSADSVEATVISGGKRLGDVIQVPGEGNHTIVVGKSGDKVTATLLEDGEATPGRTRWRAVHAAPEVGEAEFVLDDAAIGRLRQGDDTGYDTVEPGPHSLAARRPGEEQALVRSPTVDLVAGTAQTAYLVGSGGEPTRFVVLQDAASAPEVAPDTGLGGLSASHGPAWLLALLAAVSAGGAGGLSYARRARG